MAATSYDEVVYVARPEPATHPDNLAAIATLHGLSPASPARCRVLEIGCATGGNLLGLAEAYPESSFLGIDPARRQIEIGREAAASLGLPNLCLEAMTTDGLPPDAGPFDYILCHGVYSWVPAAVREGLLAACRRLLAPHGVAYVSYNAKPGWYLRLPVREILLYHTRELAGAREKTEQSRGLMRLLAGSRPDGRAWARVLRDEAASFAEGNDSYVLHEYLEEENEAFWLREFVGDAARHGLRYLSEAASHTCFEGLPPAMRQALDGADDILEVEQYVDFLRGRQFRRTLLVHAEASVQREPCLDGLMVSAACRRMGPGEYANDDGDSFRTDHAGLEAVLSELIACHPAAVPWPELQAKAGPLAAQVAQMFFANLVTLHVSPPPFAPDPGERPSASRVARWQARNGGPVADLRHRRADLGPFPLALLPLLDGTRDRMALADEMARLIDPAQGTEPERRAAAAAGLGPALDLIARSALLAGQG